MSRRVRATLVVGTAFVGSLPYCIAWLWTPPEHVYVGQLHNVADTSVYYSWIAQVMRGSWLVENLWNAEPGQPVLNLFAIIVGTFAKLFGVPIAYHFARIGFAVLAFYAVYVVARLLGGERVGDRALLLALFAGGTGIFVAGLREGPVPVDLWVVEMFPAIQAQTNALGAAALALYLGTLGALIKATRENGCWAYVAGVTLLMLVNIHPYDAAALALVWGAFCLVDGRQAWRAGLIAGLVALPGALYWLWLLSVDPVLRTRASVPNPSGPVLDYFLAFAWLAPFAAFGWRHAANRQVLVLWLLVTFIAIYLPVSFQRRLIVGIAVPVFVLVAVQLVRWPRWASVVVIAVAATGPLTSVGRDLWFARGGTDMARDPVYWTVEDIAAVDALPRDLVVGADRSALLVPWRSGNRVYAGHWGETNDFRARRAELRATLYGGAPPLVGVDIYLP